MRLAVAGFHIESVSFIPHQSTYADFERRAYRRADIVSQYRNTQSVIGGYIDIAEHESIELVPIVFAYEGAAGPASDEAIDKYSDEIARGLGAVRNNVDGVLLQLHGAAASASHVDPERFILNAARNAVGHDIPIMVTFDYHGNLDGETLDPVEAAFAYHKSPHTDMREAGQRTADCMVRMLRGEISPVMVIEKPGVLIPSIFSATALEPLASIIAHARDLEKNSNDYLDISVMAGFSYADAPNTGFSVLVVANRDQAGARKIACEISELVWAERKKLYCALPVYSIDEAFDYAQRKNVTTSKPFVFLEHADRMNDSSYLLDAVIKQDWKNVAIPYVWDPTSAKQACEAGVGSQIRVTLGAHSSDRAGPRSEFTATVLKAGQTRYRSQGPLWNGIEVDLGLAALLEVGGVHVSVISLSMSAIDEDPFRVFGQKPTDYDFIVLRSKTHFRAVYEDLAEEIIIVDTPDWGPADLTTLPYVHVPTDSVYPFVDGR